jgi:hypothetical protein
LLFCPSSGYFEVNEIEVSEITDTTSLPPNPARLRLQNCCRSPAVTFAWTAKCSIGNSGAKELQAWREAHGLQNTFQFHRPRGLLDNTFCEIRNKGYNNSDNVTAIHRT